MKWDAVIMDLDGTLVDSMSFWHNLDQEFLHSQGVEVQQSIFHITRDLNIVQLTQYYHDEFGIKMTPQETQQKLRQLSEAFYFHRVQAKAGARELLTAASRRRSRLRGDGDRPVSG